ncbi:MAG: hypothetical protein V2B20_16280 [Pseudomonadota bacterium]
MHLHVPSRPQYSFQFLPYIFLTLCLYPFAASAATVQYGYDALQRLTIAEYDNGGKAAYSYDSLGNRLTKTTTAANMAVYEDAEDGNTLGWDVYDNDPAGATVTNIYDEQRASRVIEFTGVGTANGYRLRNPDGTYWNDAKMQTISWSMRFSESFVVYIAVQTKNGFRYIYYTPSATSNLGNDTYIHYGLGVSSMNGTWQTVTRNLAYDLKKAQPDNELLAVLGFLVRGSGRVDDIKTLEQIPSDMDSDGDGLTDIEEMTIYGTNPYMADSDGDGINDKDELIYWGSAWNADPDGDGLINILDPDADGDSIADGAELRQGTDPGDPLSVPTSMVYEDAEDGLTTGWDIYDNDPTGATITNVADETRGSRVIEFTGSGTNNGYRLRNADGTYWNDGNFKVMQWSMRFSERIVVYIAVQTKDGFRYIYYTPAETDNLGSETYIHHGLGAYVKDGEWYTLIRDLEYDLKEAQPDNELLAVLGFLIRGSGRVDDIKTLAKIPADQDSDGDGLTDNEEISTYGSHPYYADTDADGLLDGEEVTSWGNNWNADPDGDGLINLLDADADGDGFTDGMEVRQTTDPANASSFPTTAVYEDGEDTNISGWDIYDSDPSGATITNVMDTEKQSRVIEFSGSGTNNGYRLRSEDGNYWFDTKFKSLQWSMRYAESFVIYVAVQSKDGFRYLYYTPIEASNLGTDTYIHHGLGTAVADGSWHTLARDLEADLKEAQPDNELESVLGFLIRGSGRVDDIKTKN